MTIALLTVSVYDGQHKTRLLHCRAQSWWRWYCWCRVLVWWSVFRYITCPILWDPSIMYLYLQTTFPGFFLGSMLKQSIFLDSSGCCRYFLPTVLGSWKSETSFYSCLSEETFRDAKVKKEFVKSTLKEPVLVYDFGSYTFTCSYFKFENVPKVFISCQMQSNFEVLQSWILLIARVTYFHNTKTIMKQWQWEIYKTI